MNCIEQAVVFDCDGDALLGILTRPRHPCTTGVVVVVGGPQYRAGSHRQFVTLARSLADAGMAVFRFDYRGMGDSEGEPRNFEHVTLDITAAIDAFRRATPSLQRVLLWGLCDGASAILLYLQARRDAPIAGLCLVNPWVRSSASLAKTQVKHYYRQRLMDRAFWGKLLSGGVALGALVDLLNNLKAAFAPARPREAAETPYQQRMAAALAGFSGPVLLLLSELDYTAREFEEYCASDAHWLHALQTRQPERVALPGADHTCSTPGSQRDAEAATMAWAQRHFALLQ